MKKLFDAIFIMFFLVSFPAIKEEKNQDIIFIDPGHGGMDGGCIANDGTMEKDINLQISIKLRDYLTNLGFVVELTRYGDYDLASENAKNRKHEDIIKRCEIMSKGKLFISIHTNEYPKENVRGAQVFYYHEENKLLSETIQKSLQDNLKNTKRKAMYIDEKYLLINTQCPGCLIEVGFISNNEEKELLKSDAYQNKLVIAIANGLLDFIENSL